MSLAAAAALLVSGCAALGSTNASSTNASSTTLTGAGKVAAVATGSAHPVTAAGRAADKALAAGASKVDQAGSAKVDGTITTTATSNGSAKLAVTFSGAERWSPTVAGTLDLTGVQLGGASVGHVTMLVTDKAIYLKLPTLSSVLHKQWAKIGFDDTTSIAGLDLGQFAGQAQQLQPGPYLQLLTSSVNVKAIGTATVDGVATRHYAGSVDLQQALSALPNVPPVWAKLATSQGIKAVHINAWIDAADRPRRVTLTLASSVLSVTVDLHLSDYGVAVSVTPPAKGETIDLTHGLLGLG